MNSQSFHDLEARASRSEALDAIRNAELTARVHGIVEQMKAEGKALELSDEEERLLQSFRRFKLRMRKTAEVFRWQTRRPEGVQLVEETAEIVSPVES